MMKTETAIIAILLASAAAMPLVGAEVDYGECNGNFYTPKHLIDDREYHPRKKVITESRSELREFTGRNGKIVKGKIQVYNPDSGTVSIAVENGRTHTVDLNIFSKADQAYVRGWYSIKNFLRQDRFHISARRKRDRRVIEYLIWRPEEIVVYDITLDNRCAFDMNDLTLEYNIYYSANKLNIPEPNAHQGIKGVKCGRLHIRKLPVGEKIKVKTLPVSFPTAELFEYYKDGKAPPVQFMGIRLRVYLPLDSDRKAMREFASPNSLLKNRKWVTPGKSQTPNNPKEQGAL